MLEQVGLTDRADDLVDTYSRGMLQRLGIADALVKDPDVLILDEPTTAIDPLGVVEILDLLRRLVRERGMAILLSSHLLNQVQSVCDRIGIFAAGRLIGQGTMAQLAERFGDGRQQLEIGLDAARRGDDAIARTRDRCGAVPASTSVADGTRPGDPWVARRSTPGCGSVAVPVGASWRRSPPSSCRSPRSGRSCRRSRTSIGGPSLVRRPTAARPRSERRSRTASGRRRQPRTASLADRPDAVEPLAPSNPGAASPTAQRGRP